MHNAPKEAATNQLLDCKGFPQNVERKVALLSDAGTELNQPVTADWLLTSFCVCR